MKYLKVVSSVLFTLFLAQPALAKCSAETVGLVQTVVKDSEDQFALGVVSRLTLVLAQADLIEAQECAGLITLAQYCNSKKVVLKEAAEIEREQINLGRDDKSHIALRELIALERRCPDAK